MTTDILPCDPCSISFSNESVLINSESTLTALNKACYHLQSHPIVFPTETVYGLGALALHSPSLSKIFEIKNRPADNPLIIHISSLSMLYSILPPFYSFPKSYSCLISHFWPGPLTLLFPSNPDIIPNIITASQPTIAVRMPSHPVARALIALSNSPIAAPSANTSGKPSPTKALHVYHDLKGKIPLILDGGDCDFGLESTVIDGLHQDGNIRILRPGGITLEQIQNILLLNFDHPPKVLVHNRDYQDHLLENAPSTPGMKYRHYSPSIPLTLLLTIPENSSIPLSQFLSSLNPSHKIGVLAPSDSPLIPHLPSSYSFHPLGPLSKPGIIAHNLFDGLISLEKSGIDHILIQQIDDHNEGLAVMNRVRKAASQVVSVDLSL